ncbi:extragenic suppressor protein SuhB (plasmid) [Ketogulonicigenium vulgare Y25]|uniref:Inositol-1-monophosphatase n=1 Tax=Ketogulonicigenium vulgare (strain WSH-001) TaxID=759362 RepID=F9YBW0_KETVW|nr:inositol monophosphatase family protein [Ketogulonicigenium vulgare]ADO44209.1 extragenic suppressor protein SuhB [Ketogulonicigenium vulgare Y25]AEM42862.1 myo-inositol-1(or 4)-monophosphatase protein [Ketogulonicigenium vulgare WSH-001]ALJ82711.1 myo-inositol-1-monophosphatase [Ketogulonicigenium vulgare]
MMTDPFIPSARLAQLIAAAHAGGAIARAALRRRDASEVVHKAVRDYQTEADVAVERAIVAHLAPHFPDHAIAGEEGADDRAGSAGRIVIDPIDGTTNFMWGMPHFGVVITLVEGGETVAGVTYDPMMDETFAAERGAGAYLNGQRLQLSHSLDAINAVFGAGLPIPGQVKSVTEARYHAALRRLMDTSAGVRRLGSSALSIAWVAAGRLDGFFEDGLSLHDYGASVLILREAGGIVTDFAGGDIKNPGAILAGRPGLHDWLLEGFKA